MANKITAQTIFNSVNSLKSLYTLKLPMKKAYALYQLLSEIEKQTAFFIEKEKELVEKYSGKVDENGQIIFEEEQKAKDFNKEHQELMSIEVDLSVDKIVLSEAEVGEATFSPQDIANLIAFITIE